VWCWGDNGSGQVTGAAPTTTGSVVPSPTLVSPFNGEGFLEIAAGGTSTCGITNVTKTLVCWGLLGDGGGSFRTVTTSNNATPAQLALGRAHGCLVSEGRNAIQCWGDNAFGQLGVNAAKSSAGSVPLGFAGIPLASGAEADFSCANPIDAPLGVTCWGGGAPSTLPQSPVSGLAVGPGRICFWRPDASAECIVSAAGGVVRQFQQTGVRAAAASSANACFATTTPEVVCSGPNVSTVFALDATALAAGAQHYCALGGGGVKCWGANKQKQASPGSETEIAAPAAVVFPR
jgi:alpha-tubulin suppressor-like RCC1 family protein